MSEKLNKRAAKPVIPVFFATDNNYTPFLAVAMTSMLENASPDYDYKIYVLTTNLDPNLQKDLEDTLEEKRDGKTASIEFISLKDKLDELQDLFHLRDYYSKETYYRFFIPNLFPEYEKVLYLDCDIVILGDISKLYNTELGNNYVAAASEEVMTEFDVFGTYVEKALDVPREDYFNAGILLMNCRLFREDKIAERFVDLLQRFKFRVTQDEDYLNVLCKDRVKMLDLGWNKTAFKNPKFDDANLNLVHYKINWKPWHYKGVEYEEYFWNYAKKTSGYDKLIEMRENYTQEQKDRDQLGYENLCKLAEADTVDPKNYRNTMIKEHSIISGIMYNVMGFLHLRGRYKARKARHYDD
ncbi:MAG: glycosyltransferase family 8 protein [Treponema sp.]|nr:glycosyltransferase family 8 protein [Treponema sp.]